MSVRWWLRVVLASGLTIGALALHSVPAGAAPMAGETVLAGATSQHFPSFFKIAANGKTVNEGAITLDLSCMSGASFAIGDAFTHIRIRPSGAIHAQFDMPPTAVSGGGTVSGTDSMTARLNQKRSQVTGVWQIHLYYSFPNDTTDQCESGAVRFTDSN